MSRHPVHRFHAPEALGKGVPLKNLVNKKLVSLIAESFTTVYPSFDAPRFVALAGRGLEKLEFTPRAAHVAHALAAVLPQNFDRAAKILIRAMGPELQKTEGNGLRVFFYLPHSSFISLYGSDFFESGMQANYELTKRMTAEYAIRPFIMRHRDRSLKLLSKWARDPNPHVSRHVSEGARPRLPWAMRLPDMVEHPHYTLPLLEILKDDPVLYVRRSVANHMGDILKDHPKVAYAVLEKWLEESFFQEDEEGDRRRWIIRHALRLPARKGDVRALRIRKNAAR